MFHISWNLILECIWIFGKHGAFIIFNPYILVMEMENRLIMQQDSTNGLRRLVALFLNEAIF